MNQEEKAMLKALSDMRKEKERLEYEDMRQRIEKSSNRKILRRQLQLLAEYSRRPCGTDRIPEVSKAMLEIYKELGKAKKSTLALAFVFLVTGCSLLPSFDLEMQTPFIKNIDVAIPKIYV